MAGLKITLNAIHKISDSSPEGLIINNYLKRLPTKLTINQLDGKDKFPPAKQKIYEGELLLKSIPSTSMVIALEEKGKQFNSLEFSQYLAAQLKPIVFIIGGAHGLSEEVRNRANLILSLGSLTMPHILARIILVEQIYRAHTITQNHPYHK